MATIVQLQKIKPLGDLGKGLVSFAESFAKSRKEDRISGDISEAMEIFTDNSGAAETLEDLTAHFSQLQTDLQGISGADPQRIANAIASAKTLHGAATGQLQDTHDRAYVTAFQEAERTGGVVAAHFTDNASIELVTEMVEQAQENLIQQQEADAATERARADASRADTAATEQFERSAIEQAEEARAVKLAPAEKRKLEAEAKVAEDAVEGIKFERQQRVGQLKLLEEQLELAKSKTANQAELNVINELKARVQLATARAAGVDKDVTARSKSYGARYNLSKQAAVKEYAVISQAEDQVDTYFMKVDKEGIMALDDSAGAKQKYLYALQMTETLLRHGLEDGESRLVNPAALAEAALVQTLSDFQTGQILSDNVLDTFKKSVFELPVGTLVLSVDGAFLPDNEDERSKIIKPMIMDLQRNYGFGAEEAEKQIYGILKFMKDNRFPVSIVTPKRFREFFEELARQEEAAAAKKLQEAK